MNKSLWFRRAALMVLDICVIIAAYYTTGTLFQTTGLNGMANPVVLICIVAANLILFWLNGMYSSLWEFAGTKELLQLVCATGESMLIGIITCLLIDRWDLVFGMLIVFAEMTCAVGMIRMFYRLVRSARDQNVFIWKKDGSQGGTRVMVVGVGVMGSIIIKRIQSGQIPGMQVVVAIDDNSAKWGTRIRGVRIVGGRDSIESAVQQYGVEEIIIAIPSASMSCKRKLYEICTATGCALKTTVNVDEILDGDPNHLPLRKVDLKDLLGREEVKLNTNQIREQIAGKTVLVTGGGGSIGSELCRQLMEFEPKRMVIFDMYENNAFLLSHELRKRKEMHTDIHVEIGSVQDEDRLCELFEQYHPQLVFHAAAHKHVPLMEDCPAESVKNNVFGTIAVARAADRFGSECFVLISTDKAVNPSSVMGATKRLAEMAIQAYARNSKTTFAAVRFGNVLGSSGSVIPLFNRQIEAGGPVTVTHPDITRYFMLIPEAARLVIQASVLAKGGEVFLLDMGEPVKIMDLAENLIRLSGLRPGKDIEISVVGLRPGEKLYEELSLAEEATCPTECSGIFAC
ncbi:MAG: polysaccharide biosynthesis protein, partial [Clostridiales bacterium]|nr:polysaccharide biosynthesis protein [Clostridiales bacterium]